MSRKQIPKSEREIAQQRIEGKLPAAIDPDTGKEINPHIPAFILKQPWYLDAEDDGSHTTKHQRATMPKSADSMNKWYKRGEKKGPAATTYRKGACENCGAMTHKVKDCLERPRKRGARYTGKDIQPDEVIDEIKLGFEAKRDRWNGYNPQEQIEQIQEWEVLEKRRQLKREEESKLKRASEGQEERDSDEDDEKYAEGLAIPGQKVSAYLIKIDPNAKDRTISKNLRIREDTAKYLLNLDVNSSHYDPKTRSMRDNPLAGTDPTDLTYAGDNFHRYTGDTTEMARLQVFAWDAAKHNADIHLQANPSQAELLYKEHVKKKELLNDVQKSSILERYGGKEHLEAPPKELLLAQTEQYVEYTQSGRIIKGKEKVALKSSYPEDV